MDNALKTSIFEKANHVTINGSTFAGSIVQSIPESTPQLMKILRANAVTGAFHDSGERRDPPRCHPGTREVVNREIMDWVRGLTRSEMEKFLWISGPAGTGKSSIAQTIAELCQEEGSLASDFFFLRTVAGRNTDTKLISTLACQLTVSVPEIKPYMAAAVASDTLVFSRSLAVQLNSLIVKPHTQLVLSTDSPKKGQCYPHLIIIDGLDECDTPESQRDFLTALSSTVTTSSSLIFIIASRPEAAIRQMFNGDLNARTRRIALDDHYLPDEDIRLFLNAKFSDIKRDHPAAPHLPEDWPPDSAIQLIVQKASGQFIFASTAMKFIATSKVVPTKGLEIILILSSPGNHTPFADLDTLYSTIFGFLDEDTLEKALNVFAFIFITSELNENPAVRTTEHFLQFDPGELAMVLDGLHSLVDITNPIKCRLRQRGLADKPLT